MSCLVVSERFNRRMELLRPQPRSAGARLVESNRRCLVSLETTLQSAQKNPMIVSKNCLYIMDNGECNPEPYYLHFVNKS